MTDLPVAPPDDLITVYVQIGDPSSAALLKYLSDRGVEHNTLDVMDPEVNAFLMQNLGRVTAPITQVGGKMLLGFDPLALAKYLPQREDEQEGVSFGAAVRTVTAEIAAGKGLPAAYGVEVGSIREGSPASTAELVPGDVITEIGGYTLVGGSDQFVQAVSVRRPGDSMALTVWRNGDSQPVSVTFPAAEPLAE